MAKRGIVKKSEARETDKRPTRWRRYEHFFLIVCEDGNVEPYYFDTFKNYFPEETFFLKTVGTGRSTKGVVEQSLTEKEALSSESNKNVDEVWAVFDKDDADKVAATIANFNEAFEIARLGGVRIAYSNEVFELWLLLHYQNVNHAKPIPRQEVYQLLEAQIKKHPAYTEYVYEHGKTSVIDALLKTGNEQKAIERAENLLTAHNGTAPIYANPSTTVHILVRRLRELIEYYNYAP
ncbi:RloB family protein [Foetidibacter luteolus]|uniref:RloB family protein n=1 Tax=Foetidibacter luteolus TaxID=2608880 RepID=UPI00129AF935|nr:RloB family protein [Foetidibacter luteolus]